MPKVLLVILRLMKHRDKNIINYLETETLTSYRWDKNNRSWKIWGVKEDKNPQLERILITYTFINVKELSDKIPERMEEL